MLMVSEHVTDGIKFAIKYQREIDANGANAEIDIDSIINSIQPSDSSSSIASKCDNCERKHTETVEKCTCLCHGEVTDRMLIFSFGRETYVPHCVGFKWIQGEICLFLFRDRQ